MSECKHEKYHLAICQECGLEAVAIVCDLQDKLAEVKNILAHCSCSYCLCGVVALCKNCKNPLCNSCVGPNGLCPDCNERSCTHPITLDKHCSQCGANNVTPKIEKATPAQWNKLEKNVIQERRLKT